MKKILIVRHIDIEGPGTFGEFLTKNKTPYEIWDIYKHDGPGLALFAKNYLKDAGGVVILGGPMNVYEEKKYPFLVTEKAFIREAIAQNIPLIGICLGAQLIACSLSASVRRADEKEIGWYDLHLEDASRTDPILKGLGPDIKVFQWHEDTFDLPIGSVLLAQNNGMNQAFRFQDSAWGFQFHIEVDDAMIKSWGGTQLPCPKGFKEKAISVYQAFVNLASRS